MYNWLAKYILAPALDYSRGTRTLRCLKELEESQWWSRDKILELQNQRLRELVKHAYDRVPYYSHIFDERGLKPNDIDCGEALVKLPILTKQIIRNSLNDLMARGFPAKETILSATGGSTGEPLMFYTTRDEQYNWGFAKAQRAYRWVGYEIGDKIVLLGHRFPYHSTLDKIEKVAKDLFMRTVFFSASGMSRSNIPLLAKKLREFQPKFIRGYPSAIYLLARFMEREGKPKFIPKAIITGGEQLYDYQRELHREVFECETFSHYSSWEMHSIAAECIEHSGYHIAAESVIVEIVDDKGRLAPVGSGGRILVTNLQNYAMPFIRYEIGDTGAISNQACPCGRGLPLLVKLSGRTDDVIFTRSGKSIPGLALPRGFLAYLGIEHVQIVQQRYEEVIVKIVLNREYSQEHKGELTTRIIDQYRPILGEDMDIIIEFVDQILPTVAGKRRVVVSSLPPNIL